MEKISFTVFLNKKETVILSMAKKKKDMTMDEVTAGYNKFIKGKKLNPNSKKVFENTLKKAVKQRGSK